MNNFKFKSIHLKWNENTNGYLCRHPTYCVLFLLNLPVAKYRFVVAPLIRWVHFSYSTTMDKIQKIICAISNLHYTASVPLQLYYVLTVPAICAIHCVKHWRKKGRKKKKDGKKVEIKILCLAYGWPFHIERQMNEKKKKISVSQQSTIDKWSAKSTIAVNEYTDTL